MCSKLVRDGQIISDRGRMLELWVEHFEGLASTRVVEVNEHSVNLTQLATESRNNEESIKFLSLLKRLSMRSSGSRKGRLQVRMG